MVKMAQIDINNLPNSVVSIMCALEDGGEMTRVELAKRTKLSSRAARYAILKLKGMGVLEEKFNFKDGRQKICRLKEYYEPKPNVW
jgi:DNA-binding transcriptional ArsR family regulator